MDVGDARPAVCETVGRNRWADGGNGVGKPARTAAEAGGRDRKVLDAGARWRAAPGTVAVQGHSRRQSPRCHAEAVISAVGHGRDGLRPGIT